MKISSEFSKYASHYGKYNIIQNNVVKKLLSLNTHKPKHILDLGCGSGALCKAIDWPYTSFTGIDFAKGMLDIHPQLKGVKCILGDFNEDVLFQNLNSSKYEHLFSASALQWAQDLEKVFKNIKILKLPISLAIFTSGTFLTLNKTANLEPLLRSAHEVELLIKKYFDVRCEVVRYKLAFESTREMFQYIKKSGVSASRNALSYKETKKLMREYPLEYLEFEVLFITSL